MNAREKHIVRRLEQLESRSFTLESSVATVLRKFEAFDKLVRNAFRALGVTI